MGRVIHFEILADNIVRAKTFYENCFNWEITEWGNETTYWLIKTGEANTPGIDGGLMLRETKSDSKSYNAYLCTVEIDDIDTTMDEIMKNGGRIESKKQAVPEIGWAAYVSDSEGNKFGLMEPDKNAR